MNHTINKEMQRLALAHPLARAGDINATKFFRKVDRETTWGLTLNK